MATEVAGVFATDAGMLCLWDPAAFAGVVDYDTWDEQLCEDKDLRRHIKGGHVVPINTNRGIDGAFAVHLRVGDGHTPAELTERESKYLLAESEPYLFICTGKFCVCALEHVEAEPGRKVGSVTAPEGKYAVKVCFIGWDEEPGMKDKKGRPKRGALPDFVVLANPNPAKGSRFRTKVHALETPK
jgi:hypothetical protein